MMVLWSLSPIALLQIVSVWLPHVGAYQYGENHPPLQKDNHHVAVHFPDTDDEIHSPFFLKPESVQAGFVNGTDGPTDDETLDQFLHDIAVQHKWAHYYLANFTSEEGRPFPYVYLSQGPPVSRGGAEKLRVWIQGGVHGDEPAGDQAVLALLGKMDADTSWADSLLEKMDILLFPRFNPDGAAYFQRTLASNIDPNRDHTKLARGQSRGIKRLLSAFSPHIAVDVHEFTGTRRIDGLYQHGMDALMAAAKNLNIHPGIRNISEGLFVHGIQKRLDDAGFRWESYFTIALNKTADITVHEAGSDANTGRNSFGLMQSIAILTEVRGIRLGNQHFQRRVATALTMISAILDIARENADLVHDTVQNAIDDFISGTDDIAVTDYRNCMDRTVSFIDYTNGSMLDLPVKWMSTTPTTANLTRSRPEAYLIPRTWSDLASRLVDSGVEVEVLDAEYQGTVEALNITSATVAERYDDGSIPVTVITEAYQKEVKLPRGSFRISTRQKNAALAFVTLEPENIDSYVALNLIPVREGDEYPIFRELAPPPRTLWSLSDEL